MANTAAPPTISMRIVDQSGRDAQVVSLGDDLTLRIELKDPKSSSFGMFARNLYARSSAGESLFLIDSTGCPVDGTIFPALRVDPVDRRSLISKFKAFRFPSTGVVNFEVQIRFCQEACEPPTCPSTTFASRRKKRAVVVKDEDGNFLEVQVNSNSTMAPNVSLDLNEKNNISFTRNNVVNTMTTTLITDMASASDAVNLDSNSTAHNNLKISSKFIENGRALNKRERQTMATMAEANKAGRALLGFSYPSSDYVRYHNKTNQQLEGRSSNQLNGRGHNIDSFVNNRKWWTTGREEAIKEDEDHARGDNNAMPIDKAEGTGLANNGDNENLLNLNLLSHKNGREEVSQSTNEAELMTSESTLNEATLENQAAVSFECFLQLFHLC